jgi:hypothetical protein
VVSREIQTTASHEAATAALDKDVIVIAELLELESKLSSLGAHTYHGMPRNISPNCLLSHWKY